MELIGAIWFIILIFKCRADVPEKCRIIALKEGSNKTLLTISDSKNQHYWVRPGKDFLQLEFRMKVRNLWALSRSFMVDQVLVINASHLDSMKKNETDWISLNVDVMENIKFMKDSLILRVIVNEKKIFDLDTLLWFTKYDFQKFYAYGTGQMKFYKGCSKLPATEEYNVLGRAANKSTSHDLKIQLIPIVASLTVSIILVVLFLIVILVLVNKRKRKKASTPVVMIKPSSPCEDPYDFLEYILPEPPENRCMELPPPLPVLEHNLYDTSKTATNATDKNLKDLTFPPKSNSVPDPQSESHYVNMSDPPT